MKLAPIAGTSSLTRKPMPSVKKRFDAGASGDADHHVREPARARGRGGKHGGRARVEAQRAPRRIQRQRGRRLLREARLELRAGRARR